MAQKIEKRQSTLGSIKPHRAHFKAQYMRHGVVHTPGHTFHTFKLADDWLLGEQLLINRGEWIAPAERRAAVKAEEARNTLTFGTFSQQWIDNRQKAGEPIAPRTREHYRMLRAGWLETFLDRPIVEITTPDVVEWWKSRTDAKTMRRHAYALFRSIMASAVKQKIIDENPVEIEGASTTAKRTKIELFTKDELRVVVENTPEAHRCMVLLAAHCGLRFGEIVALRRGDVHLDGEIPKVSVKHGIVWVGGKGKGEQTTPKSAAGERDVLIPTHIIPALKKHMENVGPAKSALLFPSTHVGADFLSPRQFYGAKPRFDSDGNLKTEGTGFYRALHRAGRSDLSFHKLRHLAGTDYAAAGATLRELMDFMGHSDANVAMLYQHAAKSRAQELAAKVAAMHV